MKLALVCGGRDYDDREKLTNVLDGMDVSTFDAILQGGARGADRLAKEYAEALGIPVVEIAPNWGFYGSAAGPIRNEWMVKMKPAVVVVFPGGKGTANMKKQALDAGLDVVEVV